MLISLWALWILWALLLPYLIWQQSPRMAASKLVSVPMLPARNRMANPLEHMPGRLQELLPEHLSGHRLSKRWPIHPLGQLLIYLLIRSPIRLFQPQAEPVVVEPNKRVWQPQIWQIKVRQPQAWQICPWHRWKGQSLQMEIHYNGHARSWKGMAARAAL